MIFMIAHHFTPSPLHHHYLCSYVSK